MQLRAINPWPWSIPYGFSQGVHIEAPSRFLLCAGQVSLDAEGRVQHPEDIRAQLCLALDNLEAVLREAGMGFPNVVRLVIYTTDMDALVPHLDLLRNHLGAEGVQPAKTLLGVARLAFPELMVELEATAVA